MRAALRPIAGTFVVLLAFTVAFVLTVDDAQSALARLRGDLITVDPVTSDVGVGSPGERREVTVSLTNHTRHRIRCIGGTATCGCFATEDLPLALEPHESRQIRVRLRFRGSPGVFKDRFLIYTDHQDQPVVYAALAGRVTAPQ